MSKSRDSRVVASLQCRPSLGSTGTFTHRTRSRRPGERLGTPDETLDQDANALLGNIVGRERPVGTIPPCDPAERTRDGECCDFCIAGGEIAFCDASLDQGPKPAIDPRFELTQFPARGRLQRILADPNQTHAEIHGDDLSVLVHDREQLLDSGAAAARYVLSGL